MRILKSGTSAAATIAVIGVAGCGGGGSNDPSGGQPTQTQRAAAASLQQAMDTSARAIDAVRGTRDSLERFGASLQPTIAQTGDVIGILTPKAADAGTDRMLLSAARQQRTFLQFSADAAAARTRNAAESALNRARSAGLRTSNAYSKLAQEANELAGLLPSSTTFNTGRLRDAVRHVTATKKKSSSSASSSGSSSGGAATGATSCGEGLSVNSVTSCPFGRNVRDAYQQSGGDNVIDVYSPVTKQTYTMTCTDGVPTVCSGGNGAVVYIR